MNETTAIESIRKAATLGAYYATYLGREVARHLQPIQEESDIPAGDRHHLTTLFGEISPAMVAAYRGAFEGAV